mgnify:CR=1 FL=1|tara:strand:+ start:248 stop:574 length:327 start_codon:yes stop_codon:yes gene_type:complete
MDIMGTRPYLYMAIIPKDEEDSCFIGYGANKIALKYGMKDRSSEEEFAKLEMWKLPYTGKMMFETYRGGVSLKSFNEMLEKTEKESNESESNWFFKFDKSKKESLNDN